MDLDAAAQSLGSVEWGPELCRTRAVLGWHPGHETAARGLRQWGHHPVIQPSSGL